MNNLYDKLLYNWERGFYSVVKDKWDDYYVVSTKSWNHGFFITEPQLTVIAAKARVGDSKEYSGDLINTLVNPVNGGWNIIENETFHPSELMGKGFQVGDKVEYKGSIMEVDHFNDHDERIFGMREIGGAPIYDGWHTSAQVKPVLPVEENKNCMKCGVYVSENDIGVIRTETDYFCCLSCDREVNKVIELLKKTKVITEGKIVNL